MRSVSGDIPDIKGASGNMSDRAVRQALSLTLAHACAGELYRNEIISEREHARPRVRGGAGRCPGGECEIPGFAGRNRRSGLV
jgi:hypothetical protein